MCQLFTNINDASSHLCLVLCSSLLLFEGTFLQARHLSCVHCCLLLLIVLWQRAGILPAFVSTSAQRRKLRSCLPSYCARRAAMFVMQGVPQLEDRTVWSVHEWGSKGWFDGWSDRKMGQGSVACFLCPSFTADSRWDRSRRSGANDECVQSCCTH